MASQQHTHLTFMCETQLSVSQPAIVLANSLALSPCGVPTPFPKTTPKHPKKSAILHTSKPKHVWAFWLYPHAHTHTHSVFAMIYSLQLRWRVFGIDQKGA